MSHLNSGLSAYNSLTDKHLAGYFNNTRIRRHLRRAGLITRNGSIVPEKEYRHKLLRRDHQRRIRECLTQAIFHKVLDLERHHRIEIKRKLQDFARKEHVSKIKDNDSRYYGILSKVQRSKRHTEGTLASLSPRPPSWPRKEHTLHSGPEGERSESSISLGSSLPNSAPRKRQRLVRLRPLCSNSTPASTQRASRCCRTKESSDEAEPYLCGTLNQETRRNVTMPEFSSGKSPYRLPVINNYVTPIPPPAQRNERSSKGPSNGRRRGRILRPNTAPVVPAVAKQDSRFHRTTVHSNVSVTMTFYGKAVHLTPDTVDTRDEVKVFQQHCGGENLCVYRGKLAEGEAFQFISRRHLGFPFSLTFFLNGIQVERHSSCCEFRHRRGSRLGGKLGQFGFTIVDGASPCYKCIIALGLDKKPTPPPKTPLRGKDTVCRSWQMTGVTRKAEAENSTQRTQPHLGAQSSQGQPDQAMAAEAGEDHPEENAKAQDDYEEDFEEEDERADEEAEEARPCAVVNGVSPCLSEEGRNSRSFSKEDLMEDHHEREDDENSRCSASEVDEEKAEEKKNSASVYSGSVSPLAGRKEHPECEPEEAMMDNGVNPYSRSPHPTELRREGQAVQDPLIDQGGDTTAGEEPKEEEYLGMGIAGKAEEQPHTHSPLTATAELESEAHEVHGSEASETSLEESDSSAPSGEKKATKWRVVESEKDTGETVTQKANRVQEKLTAAVTKETHFSSELEMSDSSSEQDEPPSTDPEITPEPDQTNLGVEALAGAEEANLGGKGPGCNGALNVSNVDQIPLDGELRTVETVEEQGPGLGTQEAHPDVEGDGGKFGDISTVDLTPLEGELRPLEMGQEQEPDRGTDEVHPDMGGEEGAPEDRDLQVQEPMEKGEEFEEEARESRNSNTGTDSMTSPPEMVRVGTSAREGNWTDQVAENTWRMNEGPGLALHVVEEGKVNEHVTESRQEEDPVSTASDEIPASILEKQDVRTEAIGEEDMLEKARETKTLVDATVTVPGIRAEHSTEIPAISNAEEETEAGQEKTNTITGITDSTDGWAEILDGGKDDIEGENEEEMEKTGETHEDEEEEAGEAQTRTGYSEPKTEISDDTSNGKLSQIMEGEENNKTARLVNTGVNDDKEEVVETLRPDISVNEASTAQSEPRVEDGVNRDESVPKTEVWQDECEEMAATLEDSAAADFTVEEAEKISLWTEEEAVRDTEIKANGGFETKIKEGEVKVRSVEMASTGVEIEENTVEEPKSEIEANGLATKLKEGVEIDEAPGEEKQKSEIEEAQTIDQEKEEKFWPIETDMMPAAAQEPESLSEENLDMTKGALLGVECTLSGIENGDTMGQREVEGAVESSGADVTPVEVETGPMIVGHPDELKLMNEENGGPERKQGDAKTQTEVPGDGIDVVKGNTDMKGDEEEQKVRAAVEPEGGTKAGENVVNIDTKGVPDESPGISMQKKAQVAKSGDGLELKEEDESGDEAKGLEEIEEADKETSGVDANVTERDMEGKLEDSWVPVEHRDPHSLEEGSSHNTETGGACSEVSNGEGLGIVSQPGSADLEVELIAAEPTAAGVKGRPEKEQEVMDEDGEATAVKNGGREAAVVDKTLNSEKSTAGSERSMLRSKTDLRIGAKFPPPLVRRSGSYTLTIPREGLSLPTFAASDRETENPLAYVQAADAITGNAFTASNQKLQHIATKDM